jgi:DnaJ-class molecular chaperone
MNSAYIDCPRCKGDGSIVVIVGTYTEKAKCPKCNGHGIILEEEKCQATLI